jgi:phospholipid/cholesterol/gamma-HCH transport system ATP-binding protein
MALRPARSVLAFDGATFGIHSMSVHAAALDFDLPRGEVAVVHVDDDDDAAALVDLCTGLAAPASGQVRFLGVDWSTRTPRERLRRRRRIGAVVQTEIWPSHMTIMDSILLAPTYHFDRPRDEAVADATALARLFGLPGLPVGRREAVPVPALVRAGCVRGFLGAPELVMVQDHLLDRMSELAVPMAQAVAATRRRGGAVLWITESGVSQAARYIEPDHVLRLGDHGLVRMRRAAW